VLKPTAIVELVWRDESGDTGSTTVYAPSSLTVDTIDASATALASILLSMTGCILLKQRIKYVNQPATRANPGGLAPIVRTGAFFFMTNPIAPDGIVTIPSITGDVISSVEPGAGVEIDTENAAIVALVEAIIDMGASNPFGDTFSELVAAYLQSRV